ncbi:MAG TPA: acetoacetate--CoA ligase [Burkholderiales bacterium]|nr:acetoacetate--CoA ligase [Burkholderiales bacterium]
MSPPADKPLWQPGPERIRNANLTAFTDYARGRWKIGAEGYAGLHRWSVTEPAQFWQSVWSFCGVIGDEEDGPALADGQAMPGARWFPDARLNFAENLLRRRDRSPALLFWGEERLKTTVTYAELYSEVSRLAQALRDAGVEPGDRVAAYLPNVPGAIIAMLAATSLGAVWSSCSPDFGVQGVLDRFGQIEPKVLFAADGYFYNGKTIGLVDRLGEISRGLPSVEKVVVVPYTQPRPPLSGIPRAINVHDLMAPWRPREIRFERFPFDHPLYILYSSGTTGVPKCIVHGAGGTLLQHMKEHQLHVDLKPGERLFYFTTCGWMMWNWLASALASRAALVLYDGSPLIGGGRVLFDYADAARVSVFGTSAKFIDSAAKAGLRPRLTHRLTAMKTLLSTGSPLVAEGFDYVYREIKSDLHLASISGGTDLISCFVLGDPTAPVWRGEIQCAGLGMNVAVFDEAGRAVHGEKGVLVCTSPFPSMPVGFWNDPGGARYRAAYFEKYPGIWCHGDYIEQTPHGGFVIYGRSDAVLNPGGVRIGTAEIYRQVESLDEVVESLVIGQDWPPEQPADVRVVLFVRLRDGLRLDDALVERIRRRVRDNTTPRHVPARIVQVSDIPRTKSGKIVELAVRNIVHGRPVKNVEALANPDALAHYQNRPELQS